MTKQDESKIRRLKINLAKARLDLILEDGSPEMFRALENKISNLEKEIYEIKNKYKRKTNNGNKKESSD